VAVLQLPQSATGQTCTEISVLSRHCVQPCDVTLQSGSAWAVAKEAA
jgi:hypothetical protein